MMESNLSAMLNIFGMPLGLQARACYTEPQTFCLSILTQGLEANKYKLI